MAESLILGNLVGHHEYISGHGNNPTGLDRYTVSTLDGDFYHSSTSLKIYSSRLRFPTWNHEYIFGHG